jgi:hypothetical protein
MTTSSKWPIYFRLPQQKDMYICLLPMHARCPAYIIILKMYGQHPSGFDSRIISTLSKVASYWWKRSSLPFKLSNQNVVCMSRLALASCMTCPSLRPWLYRAYVLWSFWIKVRNYETVQCTVKLYLITCFELPCLPAPFWSKLLTGPV